MQESPFIEHLIQKYSEQGIEQGSRETVHQKYSVCAH